jgi:dTDP-4-amino-4,6-dideoxygalactose transaminase
MIKLLHVNNYKVNTADFSPLLNDPIIGEFEKQVANFVGAKYACTIHSATMAIFFSLLEKESQTIDIPSIIPPVVPNAIITAGHSVSFNDNIEWVGNSYVLKQFDDYKIIDSAQQLDENQFKNQANDEDLMIFSFYPTKPVGSIDGGMIVSNDKEKIDRLRTLSRYGMSQSNNSWERKIIMPGWKMYMNSVQCYIAQKNFKKLQEKQKRFDEIREYYNSEFGRENKSRHLYRLNAKDNQTMISQMKTSFIQCGKHYSALHLNPVYNTKKLNLPKAEFENKTTFSIPFHEKLTDEDVEYIVKEVKRHVIAPYSR